VSGRLPFLVAGQIARHCLAPSAGIVISAASGWVATPVTAVHALRGAALADVALDGAPAAPVDVSPDLLRRNELRAAAAAVAGAWVTFDDARRYAGERLAFGRPIAKFQVNRHALVELATWLTAAEALVHDTAFELASGRVADTATARLVAGRTARRVADVAVQLHGGYGYTSEFDVSRAWRDTRALAIGDDGRRHEILAGIGGVQ
jgi:hypothetical protein